jgi:NADPH:quinone reductase-like Zn-dependent oxidoreductase
VKAVVQERYGGPEVLHIRDVDAPAIAAGEALVRVRAASVNPLDWHLMRGTPLVARPSLGGPRAPKPRTRGVDLAGIVEAVGDAVTWLQPGDEVFGVGAGSFAEYSAAPETSLALRPTTLSFEDAAAVPVAAITALQLLRDNHSLADTRRVLQPSGTLVSNSGRGGSVLGPMTRIVLIGLLTRFSRQRLRLALGKVTHDDLLVLKGMIEDGRLAPVIDRTFPLADAAAAIGYVESEHARGKVVIRVADN